MADRPRRNAVKKEKSYPGEPPAEEPKKKTGSQRSSSGSTRGGGRSSQRSTGRGSSKGSKKGSTKAKKASAKAKAKGRGKKAKASEGWAPDLKKSESTGYALGNVVLHVADTRAAAKFYMDLFGFEERRHPTNEEEENTSDKYKDQWIELDTGNTCLAFHKTDEKGTSSGAHKQGSVATSWYVPDAQEFHARALEQKVRVIEEPKQQFWGGTKATYSDLDGIEISVLEWNLEKMAKMKEDAKAAKQAGESKDESSSSTKDEEKSDDEAKTKKRGRSSAKSKSKPKAKKAAPKRKKAKTSGDDKENSGDDNKADEQGDKAGGDDANTSTNLDTSVDE